MLWDLFGPVGFIGELAGSAPPRGRPLPRLPVSGAVRPPGPRPRPLAFGRALGVGREAGLFAVDGGRADGVKEEDGATAAEVCKSGNLGPPLVVASSGSDPCVLFL